MRKLLFFVFISLLSWSGPCSVHGNPDQAENVRKLEEIEARLEDALVAIEQKRTDEVDLLSELNSVDRQLSIKRQRVRKSKAGLQELKKKIRQQMDDLDKRRHEVQILQGQVQQRLISLYKSEETGVLKTLFSAESISLMLEDYDFLSRIVAHDRELLEDYRNRLAKRQKAFDALAVSKKKQQVTLSRLQKEEKKLTRAKKLKERFLAAVRRDRSALDTMVGELRKRAARLNSLVKGLESGKSDSSPLTSALFPLQKGLLPWPVKGRLKVKFGTDRHPELGTLIESNGIEIFTEPGTPIKAVWHGRVAFAKRFQGYGNLLIVDHGDGFYTLYAQASQLKKKTGDMVKKGEEIAISGYDGNDAVYFEIRQGRTPLNPSGWITRR
ncbi:MAG: hypothetical protein C0623_03790 [Desulfuromonas sp.]|nr:MAG: hypothetical protein C0623_03790 [Desulfuromonas sp.]